MGSRVSFEVGVEMGAVVLLTSGLCLACAGPSVVTVPEPVEAPEIAEVQIVDVPKEPDVAPMDLAVLLESVVQVKVKTERRVDAGQVSESFEYGTGFFVNEDGLILTSNHVISMAMDDRSITVIHGGRVLQARVLRRDSSGDLALILVDAGKTVPLEFSTTGPRLGERVFAVGYPYVEVFRDDEPALSVGHVAGINRTIAYAGEEISGLLMTDAFVAHGCSGGPLLSEEGKVQGVLRFNMARDGVWLGLSFAEPISSYVAWRREAP